MKKINLFLLTALSICLILFGVSCSIVLQVTPLTGASDKSGDGRNGDNSLTPDFSVSVGEPDATFAITLSEDPKFISHSSRLVNDQQVKVDNICGNSLPADIDGKNGEHNGENYLAYTFYCKNVGSAPASLNYEVTYNNVTNGLDECIRVRLYVDGVYKDYAKARYDNTKENHYCDESFVNKYTVCYGAVNCVEIDHYVRFTVVVWFEGDDEDCNDSVYGQIKIDMTIEAKAAFF